MFDSGASVNACAGKICSAEFGQPAEDKLTIALTTNGKCTTLELNVFFAVCNNRIITFNFKARARLLAQSSISEEGRVISGLSAIKLQGKFIMFLFNKPICKIDVDGSGSGLL